VTASARRRLVVEADGGSRGNPGVAGYGALVRDPETGHVLVELAEPLGMASNNVAEYSGLIAGLRAAAELEPGADVVARLDSKLVVEQMAGRWKIKHEDMRRLALEARDVCAGIRAAGGSVDFEWVPRERNKDADALSNEAMDGLTVHRVHRPVDGAQAPGRRGTAARSTGEERPVDAAQAPGRGDTAARSTEQKRPVDGLRLLLVQVPATAAAIGPVRSGVAGLVGRGATVLGSADSLAAETASAIASDLGTDAHLSDDWAGPAGTDGPDERVLAAYHSLVEQGGTVVVVTTRRGVLSVLTEVLGLPADRFWAVASAPGSLAAVEVWPDGTASVAFTNRTAHLR
jgi:probable phosphoglycerate mutase